MEELEAAVEDAQYITAIHDDVPKPTQPWKKPSAEQMKIFLEKQLIESKGNIDATFICSTCLGFYMFLSFIKETEDRVLSEFILDVALFRNHIKSPTLAYGAGFIMECYLLETSSGNARHYEINRDISVSSHHTSRTTKSRRNKISPSPHSSSNLGNSEGKKHKKVDFASRPSDIARKFKLKTNLGNISSSDKQVVAKEYCHVPLIDERERVPSSTNKETVISVDDGLSRHVSSSEAYNTNSPRRYMRWEPYMDLIGNAKNPLMLRGEYYNNVINRIQSNTDLSWDMFDELDEIVFQYLSFKHLKNFQNSALYTKYNEFMAAADIPTIEDDFMIFRTLGRGGFGLVSSCKRACSGKMYAMKVMNKKRIKLKKSEKLCLNELNALKLIDSKYIVCLRYSFTTSSNIYLILDIMTGGDLGFHLQRSGQFTTREARYYVARILVALQTLHSLNIVYRDLKPENILMDNSGRTRISDLGLATVVGPEGISGACGTRGYWAPECIRRDLDGKRVKYRTEVDFFSLGVVLYEFIYGVGPFRTIKAKTWGLSAKDLGLDKSEMMEPLDFNKVALAANKTKTMSSKLKDTAIDKAIIEMEPEYPDSIFDATTKDLIQKLLKKNPQERIGTGPLGIQEIMNHDFFKPLDFFQLETMDPPFKPDMKSINAQHQGDIGSFKDATEADQQKLTAEDHEHYKKWDYICKPSYEAEIVEFLMYEEVWGPILPEQVSSCCTVS